MSSCSSRMESDSESKLISRICHIRAWLGLGFGLGFGFGLGLGLELRLEVGEGLG